MQKKICYRFLVYQDTLSVVQLNKIAHALPDDSYIANGSCKWTLMGYHCKTECEKKILFQNKCYDDYNYCPFCGGQIDIDDETVKDELIGKDLEVLIKKTDERGEDEWAVVDVEKSNEDGDFWLDAFKTKEEAELFCKENTYRIKK